MILTQVTKDRAIRALNNDLEMVVAHGGVAAIGVQHGLQRNIARLEALAPGAEIDIETPFGIVVDLYSTV